MLIASVGLRLVLGNLDLLYYLLPRAWRGGYRSPWDVKRKSLE